METAINGVTDVFTVSRFHDGIAATFFEVNAGVHQTKFADVLDFSFGYFTLDNEVQNGISIDQPLGEVTEEEINRIFSVSYKKNILPNWNLDIFGALSKVDSKEQDLATNRYEWDGDVQRDFNGNPIITPGGEFVRRDQSIEEESKVARVFTNTVNYTVTAEDGTTAQEWRVTVTEAEGELSSDTDIVSFTFAAQTGDAVIDYENHTVVIEVTFGTALNGLIPTFTLSDGASTSPESGVARDFTDQVNYTVTAADGSTQQVWRVTVTEASGNDEHKPLADFNRGFSPNGDGIGDTLVIQGLEHYRNNAVKIYDLSQRLLFSAHYGGPGDAWDGTDRDGLVPVGSYVCVIDYNEPGLGHEAKIIYVNY